MKDRSRVNLASPPRRRPDVDRAAAIKRGRNISRRAERDSVIAATGSAIDIPRTALNQGAKFGETITLSALTFAARREPVGKKIVMDVAEDITDKWFRVEAIAKSEEKEAGQSEGKGEPEKTLDEKTQTILEVLNAKAIVTRAIQFERRYGWSIIVLGLKDTEDLDKPVKNASEIDHLATYSPRAVTVESEESDPKSPRFGLPLIYKIDRGKNQSVRLHFSRVLHVATRLDDHPWKGVSVLEYVWDDMTVYRNMRWAAGQVFWRMAGLMVFTVPTTYTKAEIDNFLTSIGEPNARTLITLPEDKKLDILGPKGKVPEPESYTEPILRSISMGSGIPKTKLEGTEAGAVTGSEVNQREYYKYVSDQQETYEPQTVAALIDRLMEIGQLPDVDYKIIWESAFQLDIATEAAAKLADAQAAKLELSYSMLDEVRMKRGMKPLIEASKGRLNGEIMLSPEQVNAIAPSSVLSDLLLPDDRSIVRRFVEYVRHFGKPDLDAKTAEALGSVT